MFHLRDFHSATVKLIQEREGFRVVFFQPFGAVLRFRAGHVQVAVGAEIPHGQFGEELVRVRAGVGFLPKPVVERAMVLLIEPGADPLWNAVVSNVVGKLMDADVASAITIFFEFEEVLFTARGQQAAHAASALIASETMVLRPGHALVVAPFGQIGGDLVTSDDMEFGACRRQVGDYHGLVVEEHREARIRSLQGLVSDGGGRFDGNAMKIEAFGEKVLFRRIESDNLGHDGGRCLAGPILRAGSRQEERNRKQGSQMFLP